MYLNIPIFHHFVYDKDGHVEMEIWYNPDARPYKFLCTFRGLNIQAQN